MKRAKLKGMIKNKPKALRIACSIILCVALLCALMELSNVALTIGERTKVTAYYGLAFFFVGIYELAYFFYKRKANPRKIDFVRLLYVAICIVSMLCAFIVPETSRWNLLTPVLYLTIPIIKRFIAIFAKRKVYSRVYNIMALIVCFLAEFITFALWIVVDQIGYDATPFITCFAIVLTCLVNICMMVFSQFNKEILLRIVRKTYAGEILLGMLLLVVAFSLVLMHNEENIHSFGDALWYCFAIVTTIGFGDITALTLVGRILSVILGVYGIVAVAILTSIIVNFYNETKSVPADGTKELAAEKPEGEPINTEKEIVANEESEPAPERADEDTDKPLENEHE